MAKTKILKEGWGAAPNAFYVSAMRTTDGRSNEVESENQQWVAARTEFHTAFTALDDAYQRSLASMARTTSATCGGRCWSRWPSSGPGCRTTR